MKQLRFGALDRLRGLAAIAVLIYHASELQLLPRIISGGYLAVDFFFVLSGVVLAHAYGARLRQSRMSFTDFVLARVIRLWPLVIAGTCFGLIVQLLKYHIAPTRVDSLEGILTSFAWNLLLVPAIGNSYGLGELFPCNGPLWSLFFEFLVNLIWGGWLVKRPTAWIVLMALASGPLFAIEVFRNHSGNIGWTFSEIIEGMTRVSFSFSVGLLIYRFRAYFSRLPSLSPLLLAFSLIVLMSCAGSAVMDIVVVFALMPLVVIFGMKEAKQTSVDRLLGDISYPLYILHLPLLTLASGASHLSFGGVPAWGWGLISTMSALLLSFVAMKVDLRVRNWVRPKSQLHSTAVINAG